VPTPTAPEASALILPAAPQVAQTIGGVATGVGGVVSGVTSSLADALTSGAPVAP
jgi:hypothetical protein